MHSRLFDQHKLARKYSALCRNAVPEFTDQTLTGAVEPSPGLICTGAFLSNEVQKHIGLHYNGAACEQGSYKNLYKTTSYKIIRDGTICAVSEDQPDFFKNKAKTGTAIQNRAD
jgi:hypothetical protein